MRESPLVSLLASIRGGNVGVRALIDVHCCCGVVYFFFPFLFLLLREANSAEVSRS